MTDRARGRARQWRRRASEDARERLEWGFQRLVGAGHPPPLNDYQRAFCAWNAQRLGLSADDGRRRFEASLRTFRGGHAGLPFRTFNDLSHSVHSVFATDNPDEVYR